MKNDNKDFISWLFWLLITILTLALVGWYVAEQNGIIKNNYHDKTNITVIIGILFAFAWFSNIKNTLYVVGENKKISKYKETTVLKKGLFREHKEALERAAESQLVIDQEFSLSIIENRLLRSENWVQLCAGLLITLGMIGTVLGLTIAMGALSDSLDSIQKLLGPESSGNGEQYSVPGLGEALSGMSSAFITTLAGSVLGGFFLKVLSHCTTNIIENLLDRMRWEAELKVIPELQEKAWNREMEKLSKSHQSLQSFIRSTGNIENILNQYTQSINQAADRMDKFTQKLDKQFFKYINEFDRKFIVKSIDKLNQTVSIGIMAICVIMVGAIALIAIIK